jgi:excisionase family DNA binding protein
MEQPQVTESPRPTIWKGPIDVDYLRKNPTCSVEQATALLGVSREYGYQLIRDGKLDAVSLGQRRYRVKSAALLRLLGIED